MRVAIYGGSFDPIHLGHLQVIQVALDTLEIDYVIVVPAYINPFKEKASPWQQRLAWLQTALQNYPKTIICTYELEQQRKVPSIESVTHILKAYPLTAKPFFIIGADNLASLKKWYNFERLNEMVKWVVAERDSIKIPKTMRTLNVNVPVSSSQIRSESTNQFLPNSIEEEVRNYYTTRNRMQKRIDAIVDVLDRNKAEHIEKFDLRDKDYVVDYAIIATTMGEKHSQALLNFMRSELKPTGEQFNHVDESGDWIVVDLGDILVHLMSEKYREKYHLDTLMEEIKAKKRTL